MPFKKQCYFCTENIPEIDYKDVNILRRYLTPQARITSRRRTGTCLKHQRQLAKAIKRARFLGLVPYTTH